MAHLVVTRAGPFAIALVLVAATSSCTEPRKRTRPAASAQPVAALPVSSAPSPAPLASGAPGSSASAASVSAPPAVAVGNACKATRGPIQLAFTGPVTLLAGGPSGDPLVIVNRDGAPRTLSLPSTSKTASARAADAGPPERLALGEPAEPASYPACAAAGGSLFCSDKSGAIHRSAVSGEGSVVIAKGRAGSPLSAAAIGGSHVVYAFLADRKTSEGAMTLAFAGFDEATPVRLSEDGAGATFVQVAARGEQAVAMYIDARRVLTPVHARVLSGAGTLALGPDAVVFVGSGTDGRTGGAFARGSSDLAHVLLPMDKDERTFGMAAIRIEDQPRDDATTLWSTYPAAIDHPVIAATQGTSPVRVLRTRPVDAQPHAKVALELGELDTAGAFNPLCTVAESASFADLTLFVDPTGALWIAYTDATGTWVERRGS